MSELIDITVERLNEKISSQYLTEIENYNVIGDEPVRIVRNEKLTITNCRIHSVVLDTDVMGIYINSSTIDLLDSAHFISILNINQTTNSRVTRITTIKVGRVTNWNASLLECTNCFIQRVDEVELISTTITKLIKINKSENTLTIRDKSSIEELSTDEYLRNVKVSNSIVKNINGTIYYLDIDTSNEKLNKVELKNSTQSLIVKDTSIEEISIEDLRIQFLITGSSLNETIGKLTITNGITGKIVLNTLTISDLTITSYTNPASTENVLDNLIIKNLTIDNSNLFGFTFKRIDLSNAKPKISNSIIDSASYNAIKWFKQSKIDEGYYPSGNANEAKWNAKEVYRQLKVINNKIESKIDAKYFQRNELRLHFESTSITKNFNDWFVLFTNYIFNNFGESWWIPIIWMLTIHGFIIQPYLHHFGLEFTLTNCDMKSFWRGLDVFAVLLSPVHNFEVNFDWEGIKTTPLNLFGFRDFLMRISSAYFLFYFLKASRKFNFGS